MTEGEPFGVGEELEVLDALEVSVMVCEGLCVQVGVLEVLDVPVEL